LDFTTVGGGPKNRSGWDINWNLSQKSKAGGYIVQEITLSDPAGNEFMQYWEAWQVKRGSTLTVYAGKSDADDHFRPEKGNSALPKHDSMRG
jgi:hypothetical protein